MKFNNCYIRNKVGCHCTDSCGYEEAINQLEETKEPMSKEKGKPEWSLDESLTIAFLARFRSFKNN